MKRFKGKVKAAEDILEWDTFIQGCFKSVELRISIMASEVKSDLEVKDLLKSKLEQNLVKISLMTLELFQMFTKF